MVECVGLDIKLCEVYEFLKCMNFDSGREAGSFWNPLGTEKVSCGRMCRS